LPKLLNEAGFTVSVPLLPGHGTHPRDFSSVTADDLICAVSLEYAQLRKSFERVILIGHSMGAALAMILATQEKPSALALLAPYLKIKHQWYYIIPTELYHRILAPFVPYVYRLPFFRQVFKEDALSGVVDYNFISTRGVSALFELNRRALQAAGNVRGPLLVIHSRKDEATDYRAAEEFCKQCREKDLRFVTLEHSNHRILLDYDAEQAAREVLEFVQKYAEV
jgi:carboxylesterase